MGRGRRVEAILSEFPEPSDAQLVVRVASVPGGNLLRVETADGSELVVRLPSKTKNNIWVRTGGFLIIDASADAEEYGAVAHFLYKDQIRHLQNRGMWPAAFKTAGGREAQPSAEDDLLTSNPNHRGRDDSESEEDDSDLMPNPNRRGGGDSDEEEDEDEGEEDPTEEREGGVADRGGADCT